MKGVNFMGFGSKLKDLLNQRGMSIKELSEITGISINTLYSITKRDTRIPSEEILDKISEALKINKNELITLDVITNEIHSLMDSMAESEKIVRSKLIELVEMLSADAISELIDLAIDLLQDDIYRSMFYKKKS
jgi:transcriptional regulator with XRE-family HTH domain